MAVIDKLQISQFRNIENQYIEPSSGVNLIIGSNAQGKTNLLESIYYLGHNRSYKTKKLRDVIGHKHRSIKLSAQVDGKKIKLEKFPNKTTISVDNKKIINTSSLSILMPIQVITPDKGFIVNGTPKNKRSYLDWGLFHVKPELLTVFKSYDKAIKNINALLYNKKTDGIDGWFQELSKSAKIINQNRYEYIDELRKNTSSYKDICPTKIIEETDFRLHNGWPKEVDWEDESSSYNYLNRNINTFIKTKFLNCGPHKASIKFVMNGKDECYLSRGQQKKQSIIFWLKQVDVLIHNGVRPIILIDDISSELDAEKTSALVSHLEGLKVQSFITDIGHNTRYTNETNNITFVLENGTINKH